VSIVGVQLQCIHFSVASGVLLRGQGATLVPRTVPLNSCQHFDLPVCLVIVLNSRFNSMSDPKTGSIIMDLFFIITLLLPQLCESTLLPGCHLLPCALNKVPSILIFGLNIPFVAFGTCSPSRSCCNQCPSS
jgi:hypothetical protein